MTAIEDAREQAREALPGALARLDEDEDVLVRRRKAGPWLEVEK